MSCITKILETKGDKEFLIDKHNSVAIEGGGVFKNFEYIITFTERGHRCGYVAVPPSHPLYSSKENYPDLDVHGGVTFFEEARFEEFTGGHKCGDKWIGFDAMHGGDVECLETIRKYFGENDHIKSVEIMGKTIGEMIKWDGSPATHKTYDYMENECKDLIKQLIEMEAA